MEMETGKLFVGGISWDTTEERLRDYFQTFGDVNEAVIMKDRNTGRARGFGFVVFADSSVADKVVRERHVIDGRTVEAKKAVPRDDHQYTSKSSGSSIQGSPGPTRTKKIFVGGLASTVTESDFKMYFDQFGIITDVVVMYDHNTQRPRGFGFITFDSEEAVDKVLIKTFHELNGKMVEVKRAVPKELPSGPTRSPSPGYNYGLNRMSSLLNAYSPGYSYGLNRMDDRFSPVSVGRNGYPPYSPSSYNSMGLNLEPGFGLNFGSNGDLGLDYGRGLNSYYSGKASHFSGSNLYDVGNGGSGSSMNSMNRNVWSNGNLSEVTNSLASNAFTGSGSGTGNAGIVGNFGNIGEIRGSSGLSAQGRGNALLSNNFGGIVGAKSSYSVANDFGDATFGNLFGAESFDGNHAWRSSSPRLDGSSTFGYGRSAAADLAPNNPIGYGGPYSVKSNRGFAV